MRPLPCLGTTHADYFYGEIPCTEVISDDQIEKDYEEETGVQIVRRLENIDYRSMRAILVANHGPFVWGTVPDDAVYLSVMLEEIARIGYMTVGLNPDISNIKRTLLDKHYLRKHGEDAYYGQSSRPLCDV